MSDIKHMTKQEFQSTPGLYFINRASGCDDPDEGEKPCLEAFLVSITDYFRDHHHNNFYPYLAWAVQVNDLIAFLDLLKSREDSGFEVAGIILDRCEWGYLSIKIYDDYLN